MEVDDEGQWHFRDRDGPVKEPKYLTGKLIVTPQGSHAVHRYLEQIAQANPKATAIDPSGLVYSATVKEVVSGVSPTACMEAKSNRPIAAVQIKCRQNQRCAESNSTEKRFKNPSLRRHAMRKQVLTWLGREFLFLSSEAKPRANATEETREIFQRFQNELQHTGLSLDNTVRTRLWGKDRESRDQANEERFRTLTGQARSVSSSYYSPSHFASEACVALDLLALRPSRSGMEKFLKEYDPPLVPLRYLIYDKVVFLSGVTAILPTIEDQLANILPRISGSLSDAGSTWERVAMASFYLHRSQSLDKLRAIFQEAVKADIPQTECAFVDGYSNPGKLIEIEVTATV